MPHFEIIRIVLKVFYLDDIFLSDSSERWIYASYDMFIVLPFRDIGLFYAPFCT